MGRGLLVKGVDDPDPLVLTAVEDRVDVPALETEQVPDARRREHPRDHSPTVDRIGHATTSCASAFSAFQQTGPKGGMRAVIRPGIE
jgi:hypothetical protein